MVVDLEEQKMKIDLQKKKIQIKEKLLKEKERQRKFRRISEIAEFAFRTKIDHLEDAVLLGAFLEIHEKLQNLKILEEWKKVGATYLQEQKEKTSQLLAISFKKEPAKDTKDMLKSMKFRWNAFRKEFCGYGNQREMEELLKELDFSIEIISWENS